MSAFSIILWIWVISYIIYFVKLHDSLRKYTIDRSDFFNPEFIDILLHVIGFLFGPFIICGRVYYYFKLIYAIGIAKMIMRRNIRRSKRNIRKGLETIKDIEAKKEILKLLKEI